MSGFKSPFCVLALLVLFAAASSAQEPPRLALLVQVAGSTIAGPINVNLTVWDDGGVDLMGEDAGHAGLQVCQAKVSPEAIADFKQGLVRAGAARLRSRIDEGTADLPSTTVTLFLAVEGSEQSLANTFAFNVAEGGHSRVQEKILAFVRDTLPGCGLSF